MARGSKAELVLHMGAVPLLPGARRVTADGYRPGAIRANGD